MSKIIILKVNYIEKRKIKSKDFEIFIVPNKFNVDYGCYLEEAKKVIDLSEALKFAKSAEEIEKIALQISETDLRDTLKHKYDLIKTIMIANDYEFDLDWWDIKADPQDIETFIASCALKDRLEEPKKKAQFRAS